MKLLPAPSIEFLVNLCPAALTMKDRRGRLPIHCACSPWNGCNLPCDPTAIEILVDANPLTLKEKDRFGRLPLDFMFLKRPKPGPAILKAIVKMIDAYPDVVRLASNDHRILPLHSACRWQCSWKLLGGPDALRTIQRMIDAYPGALQMRDGGGETPIIAAIKAGGWPGKRASWHPLSTACLEGVQLLLDADPSMLKVSGRHDRLPLHCAVVSCLPSGAIQRIIDGYPEALLARDEYGETPLHRACSTRNYKMVQMLLDADPSALKVSDSSGALPLHLACQKSKPGRWLRVIERMIDAYPDALRERSLSGRTPSLSGRTPVMTAILWNDHLFPGVPHFLVGMIKRGGSASVRGVWGYRSSTALNHTLQHSPGPTLVSALIEAWPCALCLPLPPLRVDSNHVAVEALVMQESDAVIEALVEVLLHETTVGVVPDPIRASVRQLVATQPGSRRDARAIQDVFGGYSERRFFLSREDLQDMITGIYRMNKAARVAGAPAAVTPAQHIKGLAAAADNPSCLFVYLLNAGCQSLFAGFHGKSPAKAELTLRPPA
jgi:ankyrin repeat protein